VIFLGLSILGAEFVWARRLLRRLKRTGVGNRSHAVRADRREAKLRFFLNSGRVEAMIKGAHEDVIDVEQDAAVGLLGRCHFNRDGILLACVIECPVCGEKAHSFRIRRVMNLRTVNGEFYHRTATCAGSMTPDLPAAMDLLRLAVGRAV
jgi:hypothetical protein